MWPFSRRTKLDVKRADTSEQLPAATPGIAASSRTWDYAFKDLMRQYVPLTVNYALYEAIREGIPFVDAALRKVSRLASGFTVTSDDEATAEGVSQWLKDVRVFDLIRGFDTLEHSVVNQLLLYGSACAEVVLTPNGRDVWQLTTVSPNKLKLIVRDDQVLLGEDKSGIATPYERQDLFAYAALNMENDNPHGVSILRSLPFLTNIMLIMENALRQRAQRHGAPSFIIIDEIPQSDVEIPAAEAQARNQALQVQWTSAMRERWEQQGIRDFVWSTQGKLNVTTAEPQMDLDFVGPLRAIEEQVVSALELAPFMLGLQWSTTERLSQQQADVIIALIDSIRRELEPMYMAIVGWYARLHRVRAVLSPVWQPVSLQDLVDAARGELYAAQAQKVRIDNARIAWANGWQDQQAAGVLAGFEIERPLIELDGPVYPEGGGAVEGGASPEATAGDGGSARTQTMTWAGYPGK